MRLIITWSLVLAFLLFLTSMAFSKDCGVASYYEHGSHTASGERFNPNAMTAAHRTLPFGTSVTVVNQANGKKVNVTINDRGPFVKGRIIDLSRASAKKIGIGHSQGIGKVCISK